MEQASPAVFELFLDEDLEPTTYPTTESSTYSANLEEYKEETEPAFLFKGAYGQESDYIEKGSSQQLSDSQYTNNAGEYNEEYNCNTYSQQDTPVKVQSKPKIVDRIKAFEQLSNSKSTEQINNNGNSEYKTLNEYKQVYQETEFHRKPSSSLYINDEEASHGSHSDNEQDDT